MTAPTDERVARLYGLPPEDFTAGRNALAAELRAEGDNAGAAAVKALRKPTAAAWAVNQLVRAEPDLVEALLGAGGELRQAHRQAASGKGAEQLRAAGEAERAAVEALMARAPAVLGRAPSAALAQAMRDTLHAASSNDEARERVANGTIVDALRPVGLGPVPASLAAPPARTPSRPARSVKPQPEAERAQDADHARELKSADAAVNAFQRELDAAARALERADEAYARARDAAEAAAERLKDIRKRHREAKAGLREAQRKAERLRRD